ncbi:MAG TPA: hypothetical protein VFJ16_10390 [Longimicrobium sp.]|nr:hypothetical protein [Longimicrobium sp.]
MARPLARPFAAFLLVSAALGAAACDGSNLFTPGTGGGGGGGGGGNGSADAIPPSVVLAFPDSAGSSIAVGDSVYVKAKATDNVRLDSVVFTGYAMRGDPNLGTQTRVERFGRKSVVLKGLSPAVRDTTLQRYLVATSDRTSESGVYVVVTAYDSTGATGADTARVNLGGPRVTLLSPVAPDTAFRGGSQFAARVQAVDSVDLIRTVRLRGSGAFAFDTTLTLAQPRAVVDSTLVIPIPNVTGTETLQLTATSGANLPGASRPVTLAITAPVPDTTAPRVTFDATIPARVEADDSIRVSVQAVDETRVDSVGVTVLAIVRGATKLDTVAVLTRKVKAGADSTWFALTGVPLTGLDTLTLRLDVTAWAKDPAGNCGASVSPNSSQAQPCATYAGAHVSTIPGKLYTTFVTRGLTVAPPNPGDLLADLLADGSRVYLSNFTRNRVEVLPLGGLSYAEPVRVGSQPWGLALGRLGDSLYVANSGGTNISVIPLTGAVLAEAQDKRIFTQNERLFSVTYATDATQEVGDVVVFDYSDRPQFIAQASNGLLVYSTKPTASAADGTVRIFDPRKTRSEIFTGYVDRHTAGQGIVVNADSAFLVTGSKTVLVCPRKRFGDTATPACINGKPTVVSDSLTRMRAQAPNAFGGKWDTRLDLGADIAEVGLSDTTFVAASGDRNYIAVGEGARTNARIPLFNAPAGGDSLVLVGDVRDLISNTAERVIGLGLNLDGSLGVARGSQAYYFNNALRLQGVVAAGSPAGGVAMHPGNAGYPGGNFRLSFVSGIDAVGPYVDVIDNFNFFRVKRLYTRDPVVGALAVAPRAGLDAGAVALRIYAITSTGVLALPITNADLVP